LRPGKARPDGTPMVNDNDQSGDQRNGPKDRCKCKRRHEPNRAEGQKSRVNRNARSDDRLDVLQLPFVARGPRLHYEHHVGAEGCKAHEGDANHHQLADQYALNSTVERGGEQGELEKEICRSAISSVIILVLEHTPAMPGEIDRQDCEIQHHPAEDTPDQGRVRELGMFSQLRVGRQRRDQSCGRHRNGHGSGEQHAEGEDPPPKAMVRTAFFGEDGDPEADQSRDAADNVQCDQCDEKIVKMHFMGSQFWRGGRVGVFHVC